MAFYQTPYSLSEGSHHHLDYLDASVVAEMTEMMDGDAEMIIDLIDTLLESTPELLQQLSEGVQQDNPEEVREAAHALKSSTAQMGAVDFSHLCKEMEEKAKQRDLSQAQDGLAAIQAENQRMTKALEAWKASLS